MAYQTWTFIATTALVAGSLGAAALAQSSVVNGQVTKVDTEQNRVTVKHGPIKNLNMDSMTMIFRVQDPVMLKTVRPGDKIKFEADRVNGAITITKMEKAK